MTLQSKSIHELRAIAQGLGLPANELFSLDAIQLAQKIELKTKAAVPEPALSLPTHPEYDSRLMSKPPSKKSSEDELKVLLEPFIALGLHVSFPEPERFHMQFGKKEDSGNMRQPLIQIVRCAERLMR